MKKFIVSLFSNRFGIVLAAVNVCCLAKILFAKPIFVPNLAEKIILGINLPAGLLSFFSAEAIQLLLPRIVLDYDTKRHLAFIFVSFFVILQWLFIAWIARTLSAKFRPKEL